MLDNFDPNAVSTKTDKTSSGNGAGNQKTDLESGESAGGPGEIINAKPMQKTVKDHVVALLCDGKVQKNFLANVVFQCYHFSKQFLSNLSRIRYLAFFITFCFVVSLANMVTLTNNIVYKKSAQYRKNIW